MLEIEVLVTDLEPDGFLGGAHLGELGLGEQLQDVVAGDVVDALGVRHVLAERAVRIERWVAGMLLWSRHGQPRCTTRAASPGGRARRDRGRRSHLGYS